jgi:tetratricopeptide (TPR) repeat protein
MLGQEEQQEDSVQGIPQRIQDIRSGFRNTKVRRDTCERVLRDHYEHLRNSDLESQEYIARSLNVLNEVLKQPEHFDQKLLTDYITEVIRFVRNTGLGFEFGKVFIDRLMSFYKQAGYSLIELYLEKANFIPIDAHEHIDREKVFLEAKRYTEETNDKEGLVRVLLALTEYYTATSQYKKSISFCKECEQIIIKDDHLQQYYPTVLTNLGINYFTLFDLQQTRYYLLQAKELLEKDVSEQRERGDQFSGKRVLGTVLHYLGRDAERRGDLPGTMAYYIEGHRYQQLGTEDLDAIAFYHLRMAELLISASLIEQARDHLQKSQQMINDIVIAGTAMTQVRAAWADIYDKEGHYEKAKECIKGAIEEARQRNIHRIELRCLVKLFLLEIRYIRIHYAVFVVFQILKTWRGGELQRSGGLRLLKSTSVIPFQLSRQFYQFLARRKTPLSSIHACTCPMHLTPELQEKNHTDAY